MKGVDEGRDAPFRAYFHQALISFPYAQAVQTQFRLLKTSREQDKLWTCFAPYTLAIHCLNDKDENIAANPVQFAVNADMCEKYQSEKKDFANDVAAAMKEQAAAYPDCRIRAAFYVPLSGLMINILDEREGVTQFTLNKGMSVADKSDAIDAHTQVFADFYDKGRDFYAGWINAVEDFEEKNSPQKSYLDFLNPFKSRNSEADKAWPHYVRKNLLRSIGFYAAA